MDILTDTGNAGASAPVSTSTPAATQPSTPKSNGMDFVDSSMNDTAATLFNSDKPSTTDEPAPSQAEPANLTEGDEAAAPTKEPEVVADKPAIEVPAGAPKTWKPEAAAIWETIPPAAQAEIQRREADMFKGIEQYKGKAEVGDKYSTVMMPYQDKLTEYNIDPVEMTASLVKIHERLSFGSMEEREEIIGRISRDYGVDLAKVSADQAFVDPDVQVLRDENARLKAQQNSYDARNKNTEFTSRMADVTAFAQDPTNVYFNDVIEDMTKLMASGLVTDLPEAYTQAVRRNPVTWAKEEARIRTEAVQSAETEAAAKKAKLSLATSVNVQTQENGNGRTAKDAPTMEDTMEATLRGIKQRANG